MEKVRWVLAGVVGLGLFAAGYLVGRPDIGGNASGSGSSPLISRRPNRQDPLESLAERTKAKSAQTPADGKQAGYRKIVDMVSKGELRIDGVQIASDTFSPGIKVGEFFDLSGEQLAEMKRLGLARLRERQNREQSLAKIHEISESGIVFDLPADREFAAAEAAQFVEDLSLAFGADVAAMLQPSISDAYGECNAPRHIRYSLTRRHELAHGGMCDCTTRINQNEDGSFMTDKQGNFLPNGSSSTGIFDYYDTRPEAYRPRYHDLWERERGRR